VTVNQLVDMICAIAQKRLVKVHELNRPQGVRGRNSDNSLLKSILDWEPQTKLHSGLAITYRWIWGQLAEKGLAQPPVPVPPARSLVAPVSHQHDSTGVAVSSPLSSRH